MSPELAKEIREKYQVASFADDAHMAVAPFTKELEKQFLDAAWPTNVAEFAKECRAFQLLLIDGSKVHALIVGRDVVSR